ncbi:MAG: class I SAM-dependent methyltransferase [Anaerolineae bacterium]
MNTREEPGVDIFERQLRELPAFRALLRSVEARFYADLPLPRPMLDLGCGDGHFATIAFPQGVDVALDPWWGPLREAHERGHYKLLAQSNGGRMPFPDEAFATVVSNSVLEHIPVVDPVIQEVARVLRPSGWFHFCVPGPNFRRFLSVARVLETVGLQGLAESYRRVFDTISRHHYYDPPEIWEARLSRSGLQLERWWSYFSPAALTALEWGHSLGLPSLLAKKIFGRWILVPKRWNLILTHALLRRYYEESLPEEGAYLFFVAQKLGA